MSPTNHQCTILIVEDDALLALELMSLLEADGQDVVGVAESGEEALVLINQRPVDLVLMDVDLSRGGGQLDGVETAALIPASRGVRIIFVTGNSLAEMAQRCGEIPGSALIAKPYQDAALLQAVHRAA